MPKIPHVYYDKASRTYFTVVSLGFDDKTGKRIQKKKRGFKTQSEAKKWYDDFIARNSRKKLTRDIKLTFEIFLDHYFIPDYKRRVSARTFGVFNSRKAHFIYFNKMKVLDINPIDIKNWHVDLFDKNLSNNYIKDLHQALKGVFDMAINLGIINDNPATIAGNVKGQQKKVDFWTKEEFELFITTFDKHDVIEHLKFIVCYTLFMTGLRIGELQALTWNDLDYDNKCLLINKSVLYKNKQAWQFKETKTLSSNRLIYLDDTTFTEILEWRNHQKEIGNMDIMFSYDTTPVTTALIKHAITIHSQIAKVKRIRIHDLRHSHASLLLSLGANDLELQNRLGHANIKTTLANYSHLRPSAIKNVATKLNGVINLK